MCCEFCLLKFCWGFLHLCSSVILACSFLFFVLSLSGFGIRVMVASQNEFESVPSSAIFWKTFRRIGISSSLVMDREAWRVAIHAVGKARTRLNDWTELKCLIEFSCEDIWSWASVFWEIFDHRFNFSACNWVVHHFYLFLVQSWKIELFWESVYFFQVIYFIAI